MQMSPGSINIWFILGKYDCWFYMYLLYNCPWKSFSPFHWKFCWHISCKNVCMVVWWTSYLHLVNHLPCTLFVIFLIIMSSWLNCLLLSHLWSYEKLNLSNCFSKLLHKPLPTRKNKVYWSLGGGLAEDSLLLLKHPAFYWFLIPYIWTFIHRWGDWENSSETPQSSVILKYHKASTFKKAWGIQNRSWMSNSNTVIKQANSGWLPCRFSTFMTPYLMGNSSSYLTCFTED